MVDGSFPFEVVNGVPVVTAPEEIDITNAPELRAALLEAAEHGHRTLVADLTRTRFCDCSGLHTLLAAHKRAQAEGTELLVVMSSPPVLRVLALTGIDRMIRNFTSLDEALAHRSAGESTGPGQTDYGLGGSTATTAALAVRTSLADLTEKLADRAAADQDWVALLAASSRHQARRDRLRSRRQEIRGAADVRIIAPTQPSFKCGSGSPGRAAANMPLIFPVWVVPDVMNGFSWAAECVTDVMSRGRNSCERCR
jgi:anti-sigma B factor antagonist